MRRLTCGVKVYKVVGAVLGGVRSGRSVFPAQPAVPVPTAVQDCGTNKATATITNVSLTCRLCRRVRRTGLRRNPTFKVSFAIGTCFVVGRVSIHFLEAFVLAVQDFLPHDLLFFWVYLGADRGLSGGLCHSVT